VNKNLFPSRKASLSNWNVSQVSFFGAKKDRNALLENKEELQVNLVRKLA